MTVQLEAVPLTARQNLWQSAYATLFISATLLALSFPGAIPSALVVALVWRLTRSPMAQRVAVAGLTAGMLLVAQGWLLIGWPWRLGALGLASPTSLGLSWPAVWHSLLVEAFLGPLLVVGFDGAQRLRRHTLLGQVAMAAKEQKQRARALQPNFRPGAGAGTHGAEVRDFADPAGQIRLGVDQTGEPFDLNADEIAQHILMPGASGSGKTTTVVRIAAGALANGYAVAFVDGKAGSLGTDAKRLAKRAGVQFSLMQPGERGSVGYDVCTGDAADVANKLIGSFTFSGDAEIYKQIAMQSIPIIVRALQASKQPVTLQSIYEALGRGGLHRLGRAPGAEAFTDRLQDLVETASDGVGQSGFAGLQFRLGALMEGKFGDILRKRPALDWDKVASQAGVTYLGLPTTAAAEDVELFGRVVIQDLKQLCARRLQKLGRGGKVRPLLIVFDEFTALRDAPQIRDLLLQSRQAEMPTVVVQQYLPQDPEIRASVLQAGILVSHRVSADDAEALANELGTRATPKLTSQVDFETGDVQKGSVREVEVYRVHPNQFRDLPRGQAVIYSRPSDRRAVVHIHRDQL